MTVTIYANILIYDYGKGIDTVDRELKPIASGSSNAQGSVHEVRLLMPASFSNSILKNKSKG